MLLLTCTLISYKDFKIQRYLNNTFPHILPKQQKEEKSKELKLIKPTIRKISENEKCNQLIKEYKIKNSQARILFISFIILLLVLTPLYFLTSNIGILIFILSFSFIILFLGTIIFRNKNELKKLEKRLEKINKTTSH